VRQRVASTKAILAIVTAIAVLVISATIVAIQRQESPSSQGSNVLGESSSSFSSSSVSSGSEHSLTIVTVSKNGSLLAGSTYLIIPNPFTGTGNYTVSDTGSDNAARSTPGVITITGLREGNFRVTQMSAPPGYQTDIFSRIVEVNNRTGASVAFTDAASSDIAAQSSSPQISSITYTAKFECGTIFGNEGPLRPGHYDTDISIFNRQDSQIKILWNAVVSDGAASSSILRTLQPQTATSLVCNDIHQVIGDDNSNNTKLVEGFVVISVQLEGSIGSLSGGGATIGQNGQTDPLDVQVFYTANALDVLPHEILVDKITFSILNDTTGRIPSSLIGKTLDISIPSNLTEIADPQSQVRNYLAKNYNLSPSQADDIKINISNVNLGVGTMIDDHAISLSRVPAQFS